MAQGRLNVLPVTAVDIHKSRRTKRAHLFATLRQVGFVAVFKHFSLDSPPPSAGCLRVFPAPKQSPRPPTVHTQSVRHYAIIEKKALRKISQTNVQRKCSLLIWNNFIRDFSRAFYAPRTLYTEIHNGRRTPSWLCVSIYCGIYVIGTLWLYFTGHQPTVEPWIKLDRSIYYLVQSFYQAPLVFLMWFQSAGTIHVLSKLFGGKGNFDTTLTMTGYALWAPWMILIPFDIISTPEWLYNLVLGFCILFVAVGTIISTKIEEGIGWISATIASIFAFIAIAIILFTFIR
jgi:hypothetical protein